MPQSLNKILYADDDRDLLEVVVLTLETIGGFTVETCESGVGIVKRARAFDPDLIILDVMMPEVDGPDALLELRMEPEFENIPIVFITAKLLSEELDELKAKGVRDVIIKPFDPQGLVKQIHRLWEDQQNAED